MTKLEAILAAAVAAVTLAAFTLRRAVSVARAIVFAVDLPRQQREQTAAMWIVARKVDLLGDEVQQLRARVDQITPP